MSACAAEKPAFAPRKEIRVNGVVIAHRAIAQEAQNYRAKNPAEAFASAAEALAIRELLVQEARRQKLVAAPLADDDGRVETEEEALLRALIDKEAPLVQADEESCRRYYENNKSRFRSADLFEAAHILVAAAPDDASNGAAREAAKSLIEMLRRDPSGFAAAARAASACPSREQGGVLGQFARGQCAPEFEAALDRLAPAEIAAEPVQTIHGFHVLRLDRKIEGAILPFEIARERIEDYLAQTRRRHAIANYIAHLAETATIDGITLARGAAAGERSAS